ncbi:MaoC/PaaZ C-terminal domain-containing protein [Gordonia humi]|uniref:Acyl dehydratase n=1 Tax=Gordonia humi TaxID=686429 RepID=A0A840ERY6_9ACTN|nr:MaoC/PaaZ C-terminal domain-containing protein [Gordonia humi]MBB4134462.1 acyl dehydratase [Gordonia humi]
MEKLYGDVVRSGDVHRLGEYAVTAESIIDFAKQWDPQWFHVDEAAADDGPFGGLIASGIQTLAIFQRLAVPAVFDRLHVLCGKEIEGVRFLRPVRPGTVVTGTMTTTTVRPETDKRRVLVAYDVELIDQYDEAVLVAVMSVYVRLP